MIKVVFDDYDLIKKFDELHPIPVTEYDFIKYDTPYDDEEERFCQKFLIIEEEAKHHDFRWRAMVVRLLQKAGIPIGNKFSYICLREITEWPKPTHGNLVFERLLDGWEVRWKE